MKHKFLLYSLIALCCFTATSCLDDPTQPEPPEYTPEIPGLEIELKSPETPMMHVGALHTEEDFERIRTKIAAGEEPWVSGWAKLESNSHAQETYTPNPVPKLIRGGGSAEEPSADNYSTVMNDAAAAYQLALRWKISGDDKYADAAVNILNSWVKVCKSLSGDSNIALAAGIYGYQLAVTGELLRDYEGWDAADFTAFKQWMLNLFYPINSGFLTWPCPTHCWANWYLCNMSSLIAIGILVDDRSIYNEALEYMQLSEGNGNLKNIINYIHNVGGEELGQMQESGRDQGHTLMAVGLTGIICQLTWNQGDDFFGYDDNRFLKGCEYVAKYNYVTRDVPFEKYVRYWGNNCAQEEVHTQNGEAGLGEGRPIWALPYYHYMKVKGKEGKYTKVASAVVGTEGGGGDYGPNSGGYDQLGFGTLMYTLE